MPVSSARQQAEPTYSCYPVSPSKPVLSLVEDAEAGLLAPPRSLPPKYFYDARGSELFDQICDTPEYYPTRIESELLQQVATSVIQRSLPQHIVELGSGSSRKTRFLFDACETQAYYPTYWPMDVCEPMLLETAQALAAEYPWMTTNALVGDYHGGLENFPDFGAGCLYVFLGGTIGNFPHADAVALLRELRALMEPEDYLLLGLDRLKNEQVLVDAYNDRQGVTAAFNLNLLQVLNAGLQADFDAIAYRHEAVFNAAAARIEMYLVAQHAQTVNLGRLGHSISIIPGERILTEISRKFDQTAITRLLSDSGFVAAEHYEAEQSYYSLLLAQPV